MSSAGRWRLVALAALIVVGLAVGHAAGVTSSLSAEGIREAVARAGALGVLAYVALFIVGELVHVPGLIFVGAAVALWGPLKGGAIAGPGALLALAANFAIVRWVGGRQLQAVRWRWVQRLLDGLERRPITTVAILRMILIFSPPVTYALALSSVRFRDYFVGSAIGLVVPFTIAVVVFSKAL